MTRDCFEGLDRQWTTKDYGQGLLCRMLRDICLFFRAEDDEGYSSNFKDLRGIMSSSLGI